MGHHSTACAASAKVQGLTGKTYLDKSVDPNKPTEKKEDRDAVTFGESLEDSVYQDAPERVVLEVGTGLPLRSTVVHRRTLIYCNTILFGALPGFPANTHSGADSYCSYHQSATQMSDPAVASLLSVSVSFAISLLSRAGNIAVGCALSFRMYMHDHRTDCKSVRGDIYQDL